MWYFVSPQVVFGEGALCALGEIEGRKALIVTDANLTSLGIVERVTTHLEQGGLQVGIFDVVEPDPCVETVQAGVKAAMEFQPDWIIGLGWRISDGCCQSSLGIVRTPRFAVGRDQPDGPVGTEKEGAPDHHPNYQWYRRRSDLGRS
jgi:hypothetical protein